MRRRKPREMEADLDMTTFINLMVVLLAFLLVTSAFTELSQLQVNLPSGGAGAGGAEARKPLVLEVSIYKDQMIVSDRQSGPLKILPATEKGQDYTGLKEFLSGVKASYPAITEITILLEPTTDYDTLIQTMDTVRYKPKLVNGTWIKGELFPDIGIGDAPEHPGGKA
ncbi:MAG: biopolymer transporter ExbD [Pedobacter sp.]|nr:biopolymer transporter ExbD [Pedobacter sp.]